MKPELQGILFKKYPKLFAQKDQPKELTCMCWGIECGDGWYWLLNNLCDFIQSYVDANDCLQPEIIQIKEKFGFLRFYTTNGDEYIDGAILFAESLSHEICEECGTTKDSTHTQGWVRTLCERCLKK